MRPAQVLPPRQLVVVRMSNGLWRLLIMNEKGTLTTHDLDNEALLRHIDIQLPDMIVTTGLI